MTEITNSLSLNECFQCKKMLRETELMAIKHWQCDDCMVTSTKEGLDKNPQVKIKFLNESTARQIIKGLREYVNKNGSLSLNDLNEILTNSYGKK